MGRRLQRLALPYVQHNSKAEAQEKEKVLLRLPLMFPLLLRLPLMLPSPIKFMVSRLGALVAHRALLREGTRVEASGARGWLCRLEALVAHRALLHGGRGWKSRVLVGGCWV